MGPLVLLVKQAVENYVRNNEIILPPSDLPEEFFQKNSGVFVTIEKEGQLRGCIGTYLPTRKNIVEETIQNAIAAATEDCRFGPIQEDELPNLSYAVYILSEPELVEIFGTSLNDDNIRKLNFLLDPEKYGVIVKTVPIFAPDWTDVIFNGHVLHKTGLLLPDLEGIDTIEQQLAIACQKGGINPQKERILIYRFTVEKYK